MIFLNQNQKELIKTCMNKDISDIRVEIKLINYTLELIKKEEQLMQNDIIRIIKSLNYDIQARKGTFAYKDRETEDMIQIVNHLKILFQEAPENLISENMIEGRIKW